jgi:hypothetical protein
MEKDTAGCRAFDRSFIVGESGQSAEGWFSPDFKGEKETAPPPEPVEGKRNSPSTSIIALRGAFPCGIIVFTPF